jgi:hypothetical protein
MKTFLIGVAFAAGAVTADLDSFHAGTAVAPQQHPALYSFVDVYRLTVAGPMGGLLAADSAQDAAIRVAQAQGAQVVEPRFTIAPVPQPDKWLLLLAGLALAGWVAHRRLVHAL